MTDATTTDTETRPAALDQEYVVSNGFWGWRGQRSKALALPWSFDDVTEDFGDDLYDRMEHDAAVAACDILLRAGISEDGPTLSPAVDDKDADGHDLAVELVDFCNAQLQDLETALDDVIWDLLACIGRGSRVAEITYHPMDASPLPGRAVLQSITVKPRRSVAFVVDPYMRLIGLLGQQQNQSFLGTGQLIEPKDERILPREKFAIATFHPRNNDPRGTSAWRPAYNPWWLKMQTWQEYLKYLAQFASGTVVGTTSPNAKDRVDANGVRVTPTQDLLSYLLTLQNGSVFAVPHGTEVQILFATGEGRAFLSAFQLYNQEITKAITSQTLAASEAEFGTRAQAGVHQDALGTIVRQAKRALCRTLRRDVLRHTVRYNYGDKAIPLTPKVSMGEVEQEDIAKLMTAVALLMRSGYVHPSQQPGIDKMINLPPRIIAEGEEQDTKPAPAQKDRDDVQAEQDDEVERDDRQDGGA
jgi:hypothetical protein